MPHQFGDQSSDWALHHVVSRSINGSGDDQYWLFNAAKSIAAITGVCVAVFASFSLL